MSTSPDDTSTTILVPVRPTTETRVVNIDNWEKVLEEYSLQAGERWGYKGWSVKPDADKKRLLSTSVLWSKKYECHRAGKPRSHPGRVPGGESGQLRQNQAESKKVGCKARLLVSCHVADPQNVHFKYYNEHTNHVPGSIEDVVHLPNTDEVRLMIREELRKGYSVREVRNALRRHFVNTPENQRAAYIHSVDVYNEYYHMLKERTRKHDDDFESTRKWMGELRNGGHTVFVETINQRDISFGFFSKWQQELLVKASYFCLDATHDVTQYPNVVLYTLVVLHEAAGRGVPVAYYTTNDLSSRPVTAWLKSLANVGMKPKKVTIDCSFPEGNAIQSVWGEDCTIQYCNWHVLRAWMNNIHAKIMPTDSATKKEIEESVKVDLQDMMYEKNKAAFESRVEHFTAKFAEQVDFLRYFERQWLRPEQVHRWAACHQPDVFTNMETNNYVESWHNQLKTVYMRRKQNRRFDSLIFLLVDEIEFDLQWEIRRLTNLVGTKNKMQLEERATIRKANLIPESAVPSFVTPINNGTGYRVCSFTNAELSYEVNCEDAYVVGCTCPVYAHRKKTCKHMYLVVRCFPSFRVKANDGGIASDARGSSQGMLTTPNVTTAAPESISSRVKAVLARMNNALKRSYIDDDDAGKEFLEAALRLEAEFNRVAKIGHNTKLRRQN